MIILNFALYVAVMFVLFYRYPAIERFFYFLLLRLFRSLFAVAVSFLLSLLLFPASSLFLILLFTLFLSLIFTFSFRRVGEL